MSGNNNNSNATKGENNAINSLQPKSYSDPYGNFSNGVYTPNLNPNQQQAYSNTWGGLNQATSQLNQPFSLQNYYNNPFYQSTYNDLTAPINRTYQQQQTQLNNNLNAQNQVGSSYDAYQNNMLNQNYDYNMNQAQNQAMGSSANAYNQMVQNNLNATNTLGTSALQQLSAQYQPFNNAMSYQQMMNPLQTASANVYGNQMMYNLQNPYPMFNTASQALGNTIGYAGTAFNP